MDSLEAPARSGTSPAFAPPPVPSSAPLPRISAANLPKPGTIVTAPHTRATFTIGEKIGEGFHSHVFACTDGWYNDLVAKVLKPFEAVGKSRETLLAEAAKLRTLRSPYIAFVCDVFEHGGFQYVITERYHCSLDALFGTPGFNAPELIIPVARCLLQAIDYAHQNEVVHHDIHLGNIFATAREDEAAPTRYTDIKFILGDLGIARLRNQAQAVGARAPGLVPPEGYHPGDFGAVDARADIYQAALVLLQLAAGRQLAFTREQVVAGEPRKLAESLAAPFNFALSKALRRHVQQRTADAREFWRDLQLPPSPREHSTPPLPAARA